MTQAAITSYDQVIYPNYTYPQTHPRQLAALGLIGAEYSTGKSRSRVGIRLWDGGNFIPWRLICPMRNF